MLRDEAMIVRFSVSQWTARKFDKRVTTQIARDFDVNPTVGRYRKILIAEEAVKAIIQAVGAARAFHYENTLPWDNNGGRILPAANFLEYSKKMREFRVVFEKAVAEFFEGYEAYVEAARDSLKSMFDAADYPGVAAIRRKYGFSVDIEPVPDSEDFRVNLQGKDASRIKAELERSVADRETRAMKDLFVRLNEVVEHFAEKLNDPEAIFRDSLVENVIELTNLLPRLNVANDPNLERLRRETQKKLCVFEPETLRSDSAAREVAAADAAAILKKMAGYVGNAA